MPVISEGNNLGDLLKYEAANLYSREAVTVLAGSGSDRSLLIGEVVGAQTIDGKVVALDPGAANGTENAIGVLTTDVTAPDGIDAEGVMIARHAIVSDTALVWPSGITVQQKTDATAKLKAAGILIRQGV